LPRRAHAGARDCRSCRRLYSIRAEAPAASFAHRQLFAGWREILSCLGCAPNGPGWWARASVQGVYVHGPAQAQDVD
jgi:hypothetical protein